MKKFQTFCREFECASGCGCDINHPLHESNCIPMPKEQTCYHKVLHTERLFKALPETEFSGRGAKVIETYCADCGLFIKQVEIRYE
jgi:hypothetical protein